MPRGGLAMYRRKMYSVWTLALQGRGYVRVTSDDIEWGWLICGQKD